MSLSRRNAKRDENEREVIVALETCGASVEQLSGRDIPDLLVGFQGRDYTVEVKHPKTPKSKAKRLERSEGQAEWAKRWRGAKSVVLRSAGEAAAWALAQRPTMRVDETG